jgi:hypothetical protein
MSIENDDNFTFLYNEQFEKIPLLFRFSRKRFIASLIVMGVFFIAGMVFMSLFYNSGEYIKIPSLGGYSFGFNDYNYIFLILMIICFAVIAVIAGWIVLSKLFEQRAFRKATELSNMIYLTQRHKRAVEWSNWKMQNRDY